MQRRCRPRESAAGRGRGDAGLDDREAEQEVAAALLHVHERQRPAPVLPHACARSRWAGSGTDSTTDATLHMAARPHGAHQVDRLQGWLGAGARGGEVITGH